MICLHTQVSPVQADTLEEYFCGEIRSSWSLMQIRASEPFVLQGFFDNEAEGYAAYEELLAEFPELPPKPAVEPVDDEAWQSAYKKFLQPWQCGQLHWVPEWMRGEYRARPDETVLWVEAGMAFGSGSHETTRLMAHRLLDFQQTRDLASARLIDAGCGSGILSLSAIALGAREVFAFDHDPESPRVTREMLTLNDLSSEALEVRECGIEEALRDRQADLILANIQADILVIHRDSFLAAVAPGGTLALSGILAAELPRLQEQYLAAAWPKARFDSRVDGEWCDFCLFREK